jgi:glycosyltransferase involved in cell wall biosynthesis
MKLLIVSNMAHYLEAGRVLGWGPAVREIDHLAAVFDEVRHLAMLHAGPPPPTALAYSSPKITLVPLEPCGGRGLWAKLGILRRTPTYLKACLREIRRSDAVHVRCPAHLGLEALLLLGFIRRPKLCWAKYAGNWRPSGGEPFSYGLQRRWLERGIHGGLATINGEWPDQPAHVRSLHNPCFSEAELRFANARTRDKQLSEPLRLLFAGNFRPSKGAERALRILSGLRDRGWRARLDLAGDGPQSHELRELAGNLGLAENATFHGWLAPAALRNLYHEAHFLLLPSSSEGWPKVLSEAMAFRTVPLAGAVSCIPQILHTTQAGAAVPADDVRGFVAQIEKLAHDPAGWRLMADNGQRAAAGFTYETYIERVRQLLRMDRTEQLQPQAEAVERALSLPRRAASRREARHAKMLRPGTVRPGTVTNFRAADPSTASQDLRGHESW